MGLNRRTFLQKAGLGLAMLGVSETVLSLLGDSSLAVPVLDSYSQALAQPGGRKLALLVGINQYPRTTALSGCVTDVELQRELLIHRFGFKSSDILTLTDSQASRQNIETAFVEHLTEQAQAGDFVVFHFSGYGSSVKMSQEPSTDEAFRLQNSLVPVDGILPTKEAAVANDLLEETLVLLLRSLATDHVITVLDTSHIGTSSVLRGNLRVRSCPNPPAQAPSPDELVFQEQIRLRTNSIGEKLLNIASPNRIPGVVLAAAGSTEVATEAQWNGFSAGLFTYALTQYLWQASPATTIQISVSRAAGMVNQLVGKQQQPSVWHQNSQQSSLLAYYLPPIASIGADGVVTALEENGRTAQLWLAGLPPKVLEYYGSNSILSLYPAQPNAEELKVSELLAQRGVAQVESSENNLQPSTLQPSTLQPSTLQPSTLQPSTLQPSTLQPSTLQPSTLQPSTLQPSNLQPSNLQPSTVQPSTVQPSTVQSPSLEKLQLQIRSKEGLTAKARIVGISVTDNSPLKVGQLVQEAVRLLPRNLGLTIALDVSLARIERVDATSAFASIPVASSVVTAGEQAADYLFGKVTLSQSASPAVANLPTDSPTIRTEGIDASGKTGGYGLFYLGNEPIRNTTGEAGEAVRSAVNRLTPKLQTLLAAKLLRLTANEGSSRLGIRASLEMVFPQERVVMRRETLRASSASESPLKALIAQKRVPELIAGVGEGSLPTIPIGSRIRYQLENYSDRPIYFMLMGLDSSGGAIALYGSPSSQTTQELENNPPLQEAVIAPGETLTLLHSTAASNWVVQGPAGLAEIQLICSRAPFTNGHMALEAAGRPKREGERIEDLLNPLDVARAVLQDLHNASAVAPELIGTSSDSYALDVNAWATLSFIYQVI